MIKFEHAGKSIQSSDGTQIESKAEAYEASNLWSKLYGSSVEQKLDRPKLMVRLTEVFLL